MKLTIIQALPALHAGGVERGTIEVAGELVKRGHRSIVVSNGGQLLDELIATGSEHITLPIGKKSLSSLLLVKKLCEIISQSEANILHARSRLPAWISYLAWNKLDKQTRPRFITSVHGPYSVNRYSKIMLQGEQVIAISEFIKNYIHNNYADVDMSKVMVIPRGISPEKYPYGYRPSPEWLSEWQEQQPLLNNRFVITIPARITPWKGQRDFIDVIAKLKQLHIEVHGIIAGGAEARRQGYLDELKLRARTMAVDKDISFIGHRHDLKEVMSVSNIVLSLAREPEAFGRTALEALGLGVPVIAYDHGGASEILGEMYPQGLVKALDTEAVSRKVQQLYSAPIPVSDYMPFSLAHMLDSTIDLYEKLASQQS